MWRAEARACGAAELAASSLDGQFEILDNLGNELGLLMTRAASAGEPASAGRGQVPVVLWQVPVPEVGGGAVEYGLTGAPDGWTVERAPLG